MKQEDKKVSLKGKGASIGIVVCFVAVVVMVSAYTFQNYRQKMEAELAKAEQISEETTTNDIVLPQADTSGSTEEMDESQKESDGISSENAGITDGDSSDGTGSSSDSENAGQSANLDGAVDTNGGELSDSVTTGSDTAEVYFDEDSTITWPASGAILLNYSMDKMIYYSTLQQYRYNPAVIIGGEENEEILAAADGIVESVETTAQTGTTVKLDMGNGYEAIYGQLKDVQVEAGDYLEAGNLIGSLTTPTKYYSVEGVNLYFEMLKDGIPVNPVEYVEG